MFYTARFWNIPRYTRCTRFDFHGGECCKCSECNKDIVDFHFFGGV